MSTTSESREDATLDRVAAWSCAASTAVFVVVVALVMLAEGADESLNALTGEPALMPALFVFVSLGLASAAVAHRPVWRRSMTIASVAVVVLAVSAAQLYPEVVYYVLPPVALALVSTALPVQPARVVLLATAGVVCFVPLGYFVLPVPISVAALGRSATIARSMEKIPRRPVSG